MRSRAISTGVVGAGVTLVSTFAQSLGLSITQQRLGFLLGVTLICIGAILFYRRGRQKDAEKSDTNINYGHQDVGINKGTFEKEGLD